MVTLIIFLHINMIALSHSISPSLSSLLSGSVFNLIHIYYSTYYNMWYFRPFSQTCEFFILFIILHTYVKFRDDYRIEHRILFFFKQKAIWLQKIDLGLYSENTANNNWDIWLLSWFHEKSLQKILSRNVIKNKILEFLKGETFICLFH